MEHVNIKLRAVGWKWLRTQPEAQPAAAAGFGADEVALLAEMEHNRWMAERLLMGCRFGPRGEKSGPRCCRSPPWPPKTRPSTSCTLKPCRTACSSGPAHPRAEAQPPPNRRRAC